MPQNHVRTRIAAQGAALTAVTLVAAFVVVGSASLTRCGFSGPGEPGTLSEDLCSDATGRTMFAIVVLAPLLAGAAGTVRAVADRDLRRLRVPLLAAAAIAVAIAALYLVSASI